MKKLLLFLFLVCSVALMALNAHENNTCKHDCDCHQCVLNADSQTSIDMTVTNNDEPEQRKSGYCTCGGKLKFTAKAIATVKDCTLCKGTGIYYGETCTLCHGAKTITYWQSGYVCENCGTVYDSL